MVNFLKKQGRMERLLLRLMTMNVHPILYLCIAISVWHSAVTVLNGFYLPENHSLIFLGDELFNLIVGNIGVLTGLALVIALRYNRWSASVYLALTNVSTWSFAAVMLATSGVWGGVIMCLFYILLHVYVALASSLHNTYGYGVIKHPRREFYENQK